MKMAPEGREKVVKNIPKFNLQQAKKAAVLCLFYPKNKEPHFVLMKRVSYPGVHSAQISFPGGRIEAGETPMQAALRETFEETGVEVFETNILSAITEIYIPPSNFYVYPFLQYSYGTFEAPYFDLQNETVWGATAMILGEVFEILQFG